MGGRPRALGRLAAQSFPGISPELALRYAFRDVEARGEQARSRVARDARPRPGIGFRGDSSAPSVLRPLRSLFGRQRGAPAIRAADPLSTETVQAGLRPHSE